MNQKISFNLFVVLGFVLINVSSVNGQTNNKAHPKSLRPLPDFTIAQAVVTDANRGSIKVTVKNLGLAEGANCVIRLRIWSKDGRQLLKTFEQEQSPIKAGGELTVDFQTEIQLWNKKFTLETNYTKTVKESNQNNNQFSGQVSG